MTSHLNCLTAVILINNSVFYHCVLGHKRWLLFAINLRITKCPIFGPKQIASLYIGASHLQFPRPVCYYHYYCRYCYCCCCSRYSLQRLARCHHQSGMSAGASADATCSVATGPTPMFDFRFRHLYTNIWP